MEASRSELPPSRDSARGRRSVAVIFLLGKKVWKIARDIFLPSRIRLAYPTYHTMPLYRPPLHFHTTYQSIYVPTYLPTYTNGGIQGVGLSTLGRSLQLCTESQQQILNKTLMVYGKNEDIVIVLTI